VTKQIGIIAEDSSDVEVINEILSKYFNQNSYSIKKYIGKGCGKLKRKCAVWAIDLRKRGCQHIFLFHDLDRNDELGLREELEEKVDTKRYRNSIVIIPIQEIEAWLLSDPNAIKLTFGLQKNPKKIVNTETIDSPKEYLRDLVWRIGKVRYLNTVHNSKIASLTSLNNLVHCKSFKSFNKYLNENW
jgi:hypothetical protein